METQTIKQQEKIKTVSVLEFFRTEGFKSISRNVYHNVNGYPFVTFTTPTGEATMVYFSKNAALTVAKGQPVTAELLRGLAVAEVKNAKGEDRVKLVTGAGIDIEELLGE